MSFTLWLCALTLALTDDPARVPNARAVDPPGTSGIMARYRVWFASVDTNKDGMLDKEELAIAFRGPRAKPFDYVPPPKEAKDKTEEKDKANSEDKDKSEKSEKDKPEKSEKDKPAKKRDYSAYADYLFLTQLDVNNDEMISKEEFENWARDLAVQIKTQLDLQAKLLDLQIRLQQEALRLSAAERQKLEAELKRQRDRLAKSQQQSQQQQRYFNQSRRRPN
jgi:hypothetical protein